MVYATCSAAHTESRSAANERSQRYESEKAASMMSQQARGTSSTPVCRCSDGLNESTSSANRPHQTLSISRPHAFPPLFQVRTPTQLHQISQHQTASDVRVFVSLGTARVLGSVPYRTVRRRLHAAGRSRTKKRRCKAGFCAMCCCGQGSAGRGKTARCSVGEMHALCCSVGLALGMPWWWFVVGHDLESLI